MAKKVRPLPPTQINMVAEGTVLEGTLYVKEDMRVSGRIVGMVRSQKRVVVAPEGIIDGGIVAAVVDIAGSVHGDLDVAGRLVLRSGARLEGTLKTRQFIVEDGAVFNGTCRMEQRATPHDETLAPPSQVATPPQAHEAPALAIDVEAEQREAASIKQVRPMHIPSSARWVFAPSKQRPATPDEALPVQVEVSFQAEETEIPVPPSLIDGSPQDRLHEEPHPKDDGLPVRAGAKPGSSQKPETTGRERPGKQPAPKPRQPSSTRRRPMILGFFLMIILIASGYYGFVRDTSEDGEPPSPAAASGDTLTDAPVVSTEAPVVSADLTEAAPLSLEDSAETDPPDEPVADAAALQATEQERLATEQALDAEDRLLDQAAPPETTSEDSTETAEPTPEPATEEEDTTAVQAEVLGTVQRLARHLKASLEAEDVSGMDALFYRGWESFFADANAISAVVRSENVQVSGTQATVDVYLDLEYQDNEDQPRQRARSHRWNLVRMDDGWMLTRVSAQ